MLSLPEAPRQALTTLPDSPAGAHPVAVYLATLAAGSQRTMRESLDILARLLDSDTALTAYDVPWPAVRYEHAATLRKLLEERYAPTTANKILSALRGLMKTCWRLGLISAEQYHAVKSVEAVRGSTLPAGREVPHGELAALLDACARDTTIAGRRDAAIIAVLYAGGLRRAECAGLRMNDWNPETGALRVRGKRNKERLVYLAAGGAREALEDWLAARGVDEAEEDDAPLFVSLKRGSEARPLPAQNIADLLRRRGAEARVASFSPHDFRRTFVGDLLEVGVDIAVVSRMAGHASVVTTARYDRRPEAAKAAAARKLHVPYVRRAG